MATKEKTGYEGGFFGHLTDGRVTLISRWFETEKEFIEAKESVDPADGCYWETRF